jgi:hypothetical protein
MGINPSGNGSLSFGYTGDMNIMDFMESIDTLKTYVTFLEENESVDIDDTFMANQSLEIDLDDTQSFYVRDRDYKLIMCVKGIAYDTRCRAYFAQNIEGEVVLLEVHDDSTDRIYYERQEAGCITGDTT